MIVIIFIVFVIAIMANRIKDSERYDENLPEDLEEYDDEFDGYDELDDREEYIEYSDDEFFGDN